MQELLAGLSPYLTKIIKLMDHILDFLYTQIMQ
jgi:hypothetical protein